MTIGQNLSFLSALIGPGRETYAARDVVAYLVGDSGAEAAEILRQRTSVLDM